MKEKKSFLLQALLILIVFPLVASFLAAITIFVSGKLPPEWVSAVFLLLVLVFLYFISRKKFSLLYAAKINWYALVIFSVVFTILMFIASGTLEGKVMTTFGVFLFPFLPLYVWMNLMGKLGLFFLTVFLSYLIGAVFCTILGKEKVKVLPAVLALLALICLFGLNYHLYQNRPEIKYAGHGFAYMHGYSSTDLTDYTVYAQNSKLATLDHEASLNITEESEMPVLDGAEACYPVYAAVAKAIYQDIDTIEKNALGSDVDWKNGKIVVFTNTIHAYDRLIYDKKEDMDHVEIFFGARPSKDQIWQATDQNIELDIRPIGREAFVFFVEPDNPIDGLTSDQVKAIYHGDITNWKEVGGKDETIIAFQRPKNSGSQTMMEYFMGKTTLKEPKTYETVDSMVGVVEHVAQYTSEKGAMGYSFRYFLEGLHQEGDVKVLKIDGVAPTLENIENGSYPLVVDLCAVAKVKDSNPNVQKVMDFLLSDDGQTLIRETGYAGVAK
ncbi:MAG: substrate-binding domain-containing protein [Lachnospiraceae bacterium]|nr:substrate-binding domain-containing protein [Lachnospiraceae bacterium]